MERARRRELTAGASLEETLLAHGLDEWVFPGQTGDFRTLVVEGDQLEVRVVARVSNTAANLEPWRELRWMPTLSKGRARRFAFVLGRDTSFRVQVRSTASHENPYRLRFGDTCSALEAGAPAERELAVGGSDFYSFPTEPGQVLRLEVESDRFDPVVRLSDALGVGQAENDDGGDGLDCRHGWMVQRGGLMRVQVSSFGNGGGGGYRIRLTDVAVPVLEIGASETGRLGAEAADHWHLQGREGQVLYLAVRSTAVDTGLALYDPTGVEIGSDGSSGPDRGALLGIRLPRDGRYTLVVRAKSGQRDYTVQALDPEGA